MNPILSILNHLYPLSEQMQSAFQTLIKEKEFKKGEMLVRINQGPQNFFFVAKGSARLFYVRKNISHIRAVKQ